MWQILPPRSDPPSRQSIQVPMASSIAGECCTNAQTALLGPQHQRHGGSIAHRAPNRRGRTLSHIALTGSGMCTCVHFH